MIFSCQLSLSSLSLSLYYMKFVILLSNCKQFIVCRWSETCLLLSFLIEPHSLRLFYLCFFFFFFCLFVFLGLTFVTRTINQDWQFGPETIVIYNIFANQMNSITLYSFPVHLPLSLFSLTFQLSAYIILSKLKCFVSMRKSIWELDFV